MTSADVRNSYGNIPVLITQGGSGTKLTNSQANSRQLTATDISFFNSLYLNLANPNPNTSGAKQPLSDVWYFTYIANKLSKVKTLIQAPHDVAKALNTTTTSATWATWQQSYLIPTTFTGNYIPAGSKNLYNDVASITSALTNWLKSNDASGGKGIGYSSGNMNPAGFTAGWFTGGRVYLGTNPSTANNNYNITANLQSNKDMTLYWEPFFGTTPPPYTGGNLVDMTFIDSYGAGADLIPWTYDAATKSVKIANGALNAVQPGKGSSFNGSTIGQAFQWMAQNSPVMTPGVGSAVVTVNKINGKTSKTQYYRILSPAHTTNKYDTNTAVSGKYYYHDFAQYLYYLQTNYATQMANARGQVHGLPWLMTGTNYGLAPTAGQPYQIYNVIFNKFTAPNQQGVYAKGAYIDIYCATSGQISNWIANGLTPDPSHPKNTTVIRLFWDTTSAGYQSGVNTLSSYVGIYGGNTGYRTISYDANGNAGTAQYNDTLGTGGWPTWAVGDFLTALNFGTPMGKFPAAYSAFVPVFQDIENTSSTNKNTPGEIKIYMNSAGLQSLYNSLPNGGSYLLGGQGCFQPNTTVTKANIHATDGYMIISKALLTGLGSNTPINFTYGQVTNFSQGDYIPSSIMVTEDPGHIGTNIYSKEGWLGAKIQSNPNFYNQYNYAISQVSANGYGYAFGDRMSNALTVEPNPYTTDTSNNAYLFMESRVQAPAIVSTTTQYSLTSYALNNTTQKSWSLILCGSSAINGTGASGNNQIVGNSANNIITGGAGADNLTGNGGIDTFVYTNLTGSLFAAYDQIVDLAIGSDKIDGPYAVGSSSIKNATPLAADYLRSLTTASISTVLDKPGIFGAKGAATFIYNDAGINRTFVALNNTIAGYQSGTDAIIEITGYSGSLSHLAIT